MILNPDGDEKAYRSGEVRDAGREGRSHKSDVGDWILRYKIRTVCTFRVIKSPIQNWIS